ncbi:hypothetical protein D3C81_487830 [compost metagenome]
MPFFSRKKARGSFSMPCLSCLARLRSEVTSSAPAAITPSSSEKPRRFSPPNGSGKKPELSIWKPSGKGPTDWPASSARVRPLNTSMPARVTMKDGILKKATK